ncbi:hypothetical protein B0T22DRAFT_514155, partial [Podospora appendiculata]
SSLTPRMIILAKLASETFSKDNSPMGSLDPRPENFRKSLKVQDLTPKSLDDPLDISELTRFTQDLNMSLSHRNLSLESSLHIKECTICEAPKFDYSSSGQVGDLKLHEFPRSGPGVRPIAPCAHLICSECLLEHITALLRDGWFHELDRTPWIWCPFDDCEEFLDIDHEFRLAKILYQIGCQDVPSEIARHGLGMKNMKRKLSLSPRPSPLALEISEELHAHLESRNVMNSFFDPRFQDLPADTDGRIPAFSAGPVSKFNIDRDGETVSVPIFLKFLKRKTASNGRTCSGCVDLRCDVDYGSLEDWTETCRDFTGDWMWKILVFSEKMAEACGHVMDFCNDCVANSIKAQIETFGLVVTERISCPSEGCSRKLSYDEVKLYANKESAERYDRYLLLKSLSQLPNFRWCGRAECENGEVYEEKDTEVTCGACGYRMCYKHQMPWHEGLSCEEYESVKEFGDPLFQATQNWISENSKPCPGKNCGALIEKGGGCFHMTCSACLHEFCWECLADWRRPHPRVPGIYTSVNHKEDCSF